MAALSIQTHSRLMRPSRVSQTCSNRLTQALMFMCGVEALVVARDALDLDEEAAADVMCWSAPSLIRTAVEHSADLLGFERPSVPGLNALAYRIFEVLLQTGTVPWTDGRSPVAASL
jgi:hypothetical protein